MIVKITKHAQQRLIERCGYISKNEMNDIAQNAYEYGIKYNLLKQSANIKGEMDVRLYCGKLYLFNYSTLITVLEIHHRARNILKKSEHINFIFIENRNIDLNFIKIPSYFIRPNQKKYERKLHRHIEYNKPYKKIRVTPDNVLVDGYISYLIMKDCGITKCEVEVFDFK